MFISHLYKKWMKKLNQQGGVSKFDFATTTSPNPSFTRRGKLGNHLSPLQRESQRG